MQTEKSLNLWFKKSPAEKPGMKDYFSFSSRKTNVLSVERSGQYR